MRPRAAWWKKGLLALGSVVLVLVALEGGLRLLGFARGPATYFDPEIGQLYYPDQRRRCLGPDGEDLGPVTINGLGCRGREFAVERQDGVLRVVCLGDSFTFGWGVADGEEWPAQLQGWLDARLGAGKVEVLNLAQPDFNTVNERRFYEKRARAFRPDLVVLGYVLNDMQPETLGPTNMTSRIEHAFGTTATVALLRRALFPRLGVYQFAENRENAERRRQFVERRTEIMFEPEGELGRSYWDVSMQALAELCSAVRADGASFLVASFPHRLQVDAAKEREARRAPLPPPAQDPLRKAQRRLERAAAECGAGYLDLFDAFARIGPETFIPSDRFHPNALGYRVAVTQLGPAVAATLAAR